jgi:hypothetical protein
MNLKKLQNSLSTIFPVGSSNHSVKISVAAINPVGMFTAIFVIRLFKHLCVVSLTTTKDLSMHMHSNTTTMTENNIKIFLWTTKLAKGNDHEHDFAYIYMHAQKHNTNKKKT